MMTYQPVDSASLPKMVFSKSSKKALRQVEEWLSDKRDQGRACFSVPPPHRSCR